MISSLLTTRKLSVHFPMLMNSIANPSLVVLFSKPGTGTVVSAPNGDEYYFLGQHLETWVDQSFEVFDGEVGLLNESEEGDPVPVQEATCACCSSNQASQGCTGSQDNEAELIAHLDNILGAINAFRTLHA